MAQLHTVSKEDNMKKVPVPMEMDSSEFNIEYGGSGGVKYDGSQHNKMGGLPAGHGIGTKSESAEIGVDYVMSQPDDKNDAKWEKEMGLSSNSEGHFKDYNDHMVHEVDLKPEVKVVGMPPEDESLSPDCGRY